MNAKPIKMKNSVHFYLYFKNTIFLCKRIIYDFYFVNLSTE